MNRRILNFYYIISIAFLLFVLIFTAVRLKITIDANRNAAKKALEELKISALSVYLAEGTFDSEYFKSTMRDSYRKTNGLEMLAIYSSREGILYLIARDRRYLAAGPGPGAGTIWLGVPEYTPRPLYESLYTLPFGPAAGKDLYIDGIFLDIQKGEVYALLREIFYLILVYLLIAAVFLLSAATGREAEARTVAPRTPARLPAQAVRESPAPGVSGPVARGHAGEEYGSGGNGLFSPRSGLGWSEYLQQRLGSELERAAASDQDLALLLVGSTSLSGTDYELLAKYLLESFPFRDLAFEYGPGSVAVILPDRDLDRGLQEARHFQNRLRTMSWSGAARPAMGLSARNGRLVSPNRLLKEAAQALKQAEGESNGRIVAFRADPDRYRQQVARRVKSAHLP
jgi:hypothetical protein